MASSEALAIACDSALKRIEYWLQKNGDGVSIPRLHRDREVLRKIQLETIADALIASSNDTLQEARDLVASGNWTKAELEFILLGERETS
jgi:hypothetical protein